MSSTNESAPPEDGASEGFYVGFALMPTPLRRRYGIGGFLLIAVVAALAVSLASWQQRAGQGVWQPGATSEIQGLLRIDPYPVLHTSEGSVLLVRPGKYSARSLTQAFAGQHITIAGTPIERGGWRMLEVHRAEDIQPQGTTDDPISVSSRSLGMVSLSGEIVDSKCFLGVMKPGAGKVHRACAAMCLTGGMPPMLVVTDALGDRYGYVLIGSDGESVSRQLVPDVAVPVMVSGQLEQRGDLTYLRLQAGGLRRL